MPELQLSLEHHQTTSELDLGSFDLRTERNKCQELKGLNNTTT